MAYAPCSHADYAHSIFYIHANNKGNISNFRAKIHESRAMRMRTAGGCQQMGLINRVVERVAGYFKRNLPLIFPRKIQ